MDFILFWVTIRNLKFLLFIINFENSGQIITFYNFKNLLSLSILHVHDCVHATAHVCKSEGALCESGLFYYGASGHWTQISKLFSSCFYQIIHITSPMIGSLLFINTHMYVYEDYSICFVICI